MTANLSVNLNAVAALRNRRNLPWPNVAGIGRICLEAGAYGLTVHPRPDARHIRRHDIFDLLLLRHDFPNFEMNIEGYPTPQFLALCENAMPTQVTFVPDDPAQATSDHGWDVAGDREVLEPAIAKMKALGIRTSVFVDADDISPALAQGLGADRVEIYTGPYGHAFSAAEAERQLAAIAACGQAAAAAGVGVNAGHDLTLANLPAIAAAVPNLVEVSIGHAITADALIMGFAEAVRRYLVALGRT